MKLVCKRHGILLEAREVASKIYERLYCDKCCKFVFKKEIVELTNQMWDILEQLNLMDDHLRKIWDIAFHPTNFHTEEYRMMQKGIPEHDIGEVFMQVHTSQRSILGWHSSSQIWG